MNMIGIDIGTTHSKVGLFSADGTALAIASRKTITHSSEAGYSYYDPEEMWGMIASALKEVMEQAAVDVGDIASIGIASMAESGLLVDRESGAPRSVFMPWFDTVSAPQAERIGKAGDAYEMFRKTGLRNSFKLGLAKLLWVRDQNPDALEGAVWLSASGYIAYRLTGKLAFDYSLAARTFAFRIDEKRWDDEWIRYFGLDPAVFPEALPGGAPVGGTLAELAASTGLRGGIPVGIAGHDHVAAALAVGAITPGIVYDSMGTAETLVGTLPERALGEKEFASGLSFGCHIAPGRHFWMGGNSSSGGSVEWLRGLLADESLSYEKLLALLDGVKPGPTGILYFPYLTGSGAPTPDSKVKAAFIGLSKEHGKGDMIKAVLEGTAYQLESIRRVAEGIAGRAIETLVVVGGGTRNRHWLHAKADVLACGLELPPIPEATLLGAALAAAVGSGAFASAEEAVASVAKPDVARIAPQPEAHTAYRRLYEGGYLALQQPLRQFGALPRE